MLTTKVIIRRNDIRYVQGQIGVETERRRRVVIRKIRVYAQEGSPVLTGYNREHIYEAEDEVVATSGYDGFLEFGTTRMRARPHMRPAVRRARVEMYSYFRDFQAAITR